MPAARQDLPARSASLGARSALYRLHQSGAARTGISERRGQGNTVAVSGTCGHVSPRIRGSEVRQRFTVLEAKNGRAADRQKRKLARWRSSLHGSDWRSYAKIADLSSVRNQPG